MEFLLIILAFALAFQYIVGPITVYFVFRRKPAIPNWARIIDPFQDHRTGKFFDQIREELDEFGFKAVAFLRGIKGEEIMILHNCEEMDAAIACSLKPNRNKYNDLEFITKFCNGFSICTNNATLPGTLTGSEPEKDHYWYPNMKTINLYQIHRKILKKHDLSSPKVLPLEESVVQDLLNNYRKSTEYDVAAGYRKYNPQSETFSLTLKGAALLTWTMCFPVKQIRSQFFRFRSRKILNSSD